MRVLIVDDEAAARRRLSIMLDDLDVEVVGEAENGVEALELAAERSPDLLLLDIAMPEVDGFDVARHLPEPKPLIVFQTAFNEYALEAFEHEAVDYIIKPVQRDKLERALERARDRLGHGTGAGLSSDVLRQLRAVVAPTPTASPRVLVRERGGHRLVPFTDIVVFAASEGLVYAETADAEYLTDYTLKELEERTAGSFVRISRSEMVNLAAIERIESNGDGSAKVTLTDGREVRVARRRAADVRAVLQG